jgi:hypothetical protein
VRRREHLEGQCLDCWANNGRDGSFIVVAAMSHSLRRGIELIYVVGRTEEQEIK